MYLLLPLESQTDPNDVSLRINWGGINSCVSVVEVMNNSSFLDTQRCNNGGENFSTAGTEPLGSESTDGTLIHFANSSADISSLQETVVLAIHTGKIYSIVEVVSNTSAESPFEVNSDGKVSSEYASYSDYFNKK